MAEGAVVVLFLNNTFSIPFKQQNEPPSACEKYQFLLTKQSWNLDTDDPSLLFSNLPLLIIVIFVLLGALGK